MTGNIGHACDTLQGLGDDRNRPGIVSTLVALYANMDDTQGAIDVLDKAVDWYKNHGVRPKKKSCCVAHSARSEICKNRTVFFGFFFNFNFLIFFFLNFFKFIFLFFYFLYISSIFYLFSG